MLCLMMFIPITHSVLHWLIYLEFFSLTEEGKRKHESGWEEKMHILPSHKDQEFPRFWSISASRQHNSGI